MRARQGKLDTMVKAAILAAIIIIMSFTPLGYLRISFVEITFIPIVIAIGAIILGPKTGLVLGFVFGLTSFLQCFSAFGASVFGMFLFSLNPYFTALICFVPRMLAGYLAGLIFKGLYSVDKTKIVSYSLASLSSALLNTIFFMGALILLFWNNSEFTSTMNSWNLSTDSLWGFLTAFVGLNGILESAACLIIGTTITKTVHIAAKRMN